MFRILLSVVLLTFSWSPYADTLTGKVVKVTDGDTITILDTSKTQHRIRLQGIDAKEVEKLKKVSERYELSPIDLLKVMLLPGYRPHS